MNKLIICTTGTSIANACSSQRDLLRQHKAWDDEAEPLRREITEFLRRPENDLRQQSVRRAICAEMNSLDRLDIKKTDRVVLLASDTAQGRVCADMVKEVILKAYALGTAQVERIRVKDLQVHDSRKLREHGLMSLVKVLIDDYLANINVRDSYEIILNATGGFKGTVPFLTILGMLYGKRTVYTFEFADELITLPPLPFSFDLDMYTRVKPALDYLEKETGIAEVAYLNKVKDYSPSERELFMAFTEPLEDGKVTLSPLAFCLLELDKKDNTVLVTQDVVKILNKYHGTQHQIVFERLLENLRHPLWRQQHLEPWRTTDLRVTKHKGKGGERIAGFIKDGIFRVTHAFTDHKEYERTLAEFSKSDFDNVKFSPWESQEDVGVDEEYHDEVVGERDKLILQNRELKEKINQLERHDEELTLAEEIHSEQEKHLQSSLDRKQSEISSLKQQVLSLQATVATLEQETLSLKNQLEKERNARKMNLMGLARRIFKNRNSG